jgi:hypothetical protein
MIKIESLTPYIVKYLSALPAHAFRLLPDERESSKNPSRRIPKRRAIG